MSDQLFNRFVKVRVYALTDLKYSGELGGYFFPVINYNQGYTEFSSVQDNGDPGFRIKSKVLQVQSTVGFASIAGTIDLYNLGPDSRAIVQSRVGTKFEIFAGYNQNVKQIALGNLLLAKTVKEGPDYVTRVTIGDGHLAGANGFINTSLKGQVSYQQAVDACLAALEPAGIFAGNIDLPSSGGYSNGLVLNGSPFEELAKICAKMNRTMTVRGQAVSILPVGADNGNPIIEISEDTGIVGIPQTKPPGIDGAPPASGSATVVDNDLSITHLLNADLVVGQAIRVKSKFVQGEFTILTNTYDIDSWTGPFYNELECAKILSGGANGG